MRKWAYRLFLFIAAFFVGYWLVIKALLLWVQYVPNHFFNTLETVLGIEASARQISISQNWNHAAISVSGLQLKGNQWRFNAGHLQTDLNFFYVWLPYKPVGERFHLQNAHFSLKTSQTPSEEKAVSLEDMNRYLTHWPVGRLWKTVRVANSGFSYENHTDKLQAQFKRFQSYFGLRWSFGGIVEVTLNDEPASQIQLKGDFKVHRIRGLQQGSTSLSFLSPLSLDSLYHWLPSVWGEKLPTGELLGTVQGSMSQYQWNDVNIGLQTQALLWPENDAFLPENLSLDIKIDKTKLDTAIRRGNWNFSVEKVRMNNAYVKHLSPIQLTLNEAKDLDFSVETFDLAPVESLFKLALKTFGLPEMTDSVESFNLKHLSGQLNLDKAELTELSFEMPELSVIGNPDNNIPEVQAKGIHFMFKDQLAQLALEEPIQVTYPAWYPQPIALNLKNALKIAFASDSAHWHLQPTTVMVDKIPVSLELKSGGKDHLELRADTFIKDIATLKPYLPYSIMAEPLSHWLKTALVKGQNIQGDVYFNGPIQEFPFEKGQGVFLAHAQVEDAELKFQPDWPSISGFNAKLEFVPYRLKITSAKANMDGIPVKDVEVVIDQLDSKNIAVEIQGQSKTDLNNALTFLNHTPLTKQPKLKRFLSTKLKADGNVHVKLSKIWVPVHGYDDKESQVTGSAQVQQANVTLFDQLHFNEVTGTVFFTRESAKTNSPVLYRFEGGKGLLNLKTDKDTLVFDGQGQANLDYPYLKGPTDWEAAVKLPFKDAPTQISASTSVKALKTFLPAPLDRLTSLNNESDDPRAKLHMQVKGDSIEATGHVADQAAFQLNWEGDDARLTNAKIMLGSDTALSRLPTDPGLAIGGHLVEVDAHQWLEKWSQLPMENGAGATADMPWLPSTLKVDRIHYKKQTFHNVLFNLDRIDRNTDSRLAFNVAAEEFALVGKQTAENEYDVFLSNLKWQGSEKTLEPPAHVNEQQKQSGQIDEAARLVCKTREHNFPAINFSGENLAIGEKRIRNVHFRMDDLPDQLKVTNLILSVGDVDGDIQGNYVYNKMTSQSLLNARLDAKKIEDVAKFAGVKKGFTGKKGSLDARLEWAGDYSCYALQNLNGQIEFEVKDGVIKDADPGLARILGLLSFESLARRLQLDLKDITNQGLVFNSIKGTGVLKQGVLDLSKFSLKAPAANASMTGTVNLNNETLDLTAEVTPAIGSTLPAVAIISGIATPIAGLAAYALLKAVPSVNEDLVTYQYRVTGTFEDPKVKDKGPSLDVLRKK